MSDTYLALVDRHATSDSAASLADRVIDRLAELGIIASSPNSDCVYNGQGYPPGPQIDKYCLQGEGLLSYWDVIPIGVEVTVGRWVNFFGFPVFDHSQCPACGSTFSDDRGVMDQIFDAVGEFINDDKMARIECPSCHAAVSAGDWHTVPHLGFCHLAFQFWNWPSFDREAWQISIPDLVAETLGHPVITTYGRM